MMRTLKRVLAVLGILVLALVVAVATGLVGPRYVVNFSRKPIFGAGGGHHSPIAGYLEAEDLAFVLDVNAEFKPWLVERDRLYAAVNTVDDGQKRGLLLIE